MSITNARSQQGNITNTQRPCGNDNVIFYTYMCEY